MTTSLQEKAYENPAVLYMAMELSAKKWRLAFSDGTKRRQVSIGAGDIAALVEPVGKARAKWGLSGSCRVVSCYEAGRDGFWIHRKLKALGIENRVVDAASIEVSRRARRAKTDRLDAEALLEKLMRHEGGERRVWRVVRVPDPQWEDLRHLGRERGRLLGERNRHRNRIGSDLVRHGVRVRIDKRFPQRLEGARLIDGQPLPEELKAGVMREWERLELVSQQIKAVERRIDERIKAGGPLQAVKALMLFRGVGWGWVGAWTLVVEIFGWREIANRRELSGLVGLVPSPYNSGKMVREQGISKAGNWRVRSLMIQLAWLWLRYQPQSEHSRWFQERVKGASARQRRIAIVALARRLVIDLWRFLRSGVVPEGAQLKVA
jgi:transposase